MKLLITILLLACSLTGRAADVSLSTLKPQDGDDTKQLLQRIAESTRLAQTNGISTNTTFGLSADSPIPVLGVQGRFNFQVARDTTATGVHAGDVLAPQITLNDVALSSTNAITLHKFLFISGDATTTNDFVALICSAPITWPGTNTAANLIASEVFTNLAGVIDSTDSNQGKWSTIGTNRVWYSYGLSMPLKPATNSLFLYFKNSSDVTNVNTAYATLKFYKD